MRYWIGNIESVSTHWDCECEIDYIHAYADQSVCAKCGADQAEMPDSRAEDMDCLETCHIDQPCPHGMDCDHEDSGRAQMWRDMENEAKIDRQWERYWLSWMMRINRRIK